MGKKAAKSTRKFAQSGQLKKTIQARRKHQEVRKRAEKRKGKKTGKENGKGPLAVADNGGSEEESEEEMDVDEPISKRSQGKTVDDFLGEFAGSDDEGDDNVFDSGDSDEGSEDEGDGEDNASFASVDDLDNEGEEHILELSKLAEKDPEFYQYLQENDKELLDFNPEAIDEGIDEADDGDFDSESKETAPVLSLDILKGWSKALLEKRSLRALRKLLVAFRAATHMNDADQVLAWTIDSSAVYNKLVTTALRYTPIVLEHHCQYKSFPNGKFKPPIQTQKWKTLQKMILSYFYNIIHILTQLSDTTMVSLAVSESAKLVPYIVGSRKAVKEYLKVCLDLWSSSEDDVRIAAFLAIRRLGSATDESILNMALKNIYLTLVRSCKSTSVHTLPSINLMKNSASEIYSLDHGAAYQHAFGYIRQLAIHLRTSMKVKNKESYKQVYNWQYVHCVDFWSIVLARACDRQSQLDRGGDESELKALIYPLVQVTLGAIKLIPNSRSYPLHLHLIRSLLHLTRHTFIYVPLAPYLLTILTTTLSSTSKPKSSTLRPLDLETHIRTPQQYLKTRVYNEVLAEETTHLLAEYLSSPPVHGSVAFPEVVVPITTTLRKAIKSAKTSSWKAKESGLAKGLVERIEESANWIEQQRKTLSFAPNRLEEVQQWERDLKLEDAPLNKYVKVQKKVREKRKLLVEKARVGEDEILEDD